MNRRTKHLLSWFLTASLLFGGIVSSTHFHAPLGDHDATTASFSCDCQFHQTSSTDLPVSNQDDDESECAICKLLASFHADSPQETVSGVEIELAGYVTCKPDTNCSRSIRLFQGRAPPIA